MSFAAGARVANNQNVAISRIEEEGKFRADRLAQVARAEEARTNANTISNNAKTATTTINANASIEAEKAKRGDKGKTSMAGKLAGGAALIGAHFMIKNRKDEKNPMLTQLQTRITNYDGKVTESDQAIDELQAKLAKPPTQKTDEVAEVQEAASATNVTQPLSSNTSQTSGFSPADRLNQVIFYGEGTLGDKGFNTQFTGTQFSDLSKHPRQIRSSGEFTSDAAGKFQFLSTTWDEAKSALDLKDFSKESQLKAGRYLIEKRGVNPDQLFKTREEFKTAMDKLAPEWASLPYSGVSPKGFGRGSSYHGQYGKSLDELWNVYQQGLKQ